MRYIVEENTTNHVHELDAQLKIEAISHTDANN